jgi:hypothetical protein
MRLLIRLVVMYYTALISEKSFGETETSESVSLTSITRVGGINEINTLLSEAMGSNTNYVYLESGVMMESFESVLNILALSLSDRCPIVGNLRMNKLWPGIGLSRVVCLGEIDAEAFARAVVSPDVIRHALLMYTAQHGCEDKLKEALTYVMLHAIRPEGDEAMTGFNKHVMMIPRMDTRSSAVGMCLSTVRSWNMVEFSFEMPSLEQFIAKSVQLYMQLSIGVNMALAETALHQMHYMDSDREARDKTARELFSIGIMSPVLSNACAAQYAVLKKDISIHAIEGIRFPGNAVKEVMSKRSLIWEKILQFEEVVHLTNCVHTASAVAGCFLPIKVKGNLALEKWMRTESIVDSVDERDGLYMIADLDDVDIAAIQIDRRLGVVTETTEVKIMKNYRGVVADGQFTFGYDDDETQTEFAFRINTHESMVKAMHGWMAKKEIVWYTDKTVIYDVPRGLIDTKDEYRPMAYKTGIFKTVPGEKPKVEKELLFGEKAFGGAKKRLTSAESDDFVIIQSLMHGTLPGFVRAIRDLLEMEDPKSEPGIVMMRYDEVISRIDGEPAEEIMAVIQPQDRSLAASAIARVCRAGARFSGNRDGFEYMERVAAGWDMISASECMRPTAQNTNVTLTEEEQEEIIEAVNEGNMTISAALEAGMEWKTFLDRQATRKEMEKMMHKTEEQIDEALKEQGFPEQGKQSKSATPTQQTGEKEEEAIYPEYSDGPEEEKSKEQDAPDVGQSSLEIEPVQFSKERQGE